MISFNLFNEISDIKAIMKERKRTCVVEKKEKKYFQPKRAIF